MTVASLLALALIGSTVSPLELPGADGPIGFDDLRFSPELQKVIVETDRRARQARGFTRLRTLGRPSNEVWVSEPSRRVIEIFRLSAGSPPALTKSGTIDVPDGPESLEIDPAGGRAYTNTWHSSTVAVDVSSRKIVAHWDNGCEGSRGLALDPQRELVFVGCDEGGAAALSTRDGHVTGRAKAGKGVDVIAYSGRLSHLYVPAEDAATVTIIAVGDDGALQSVGEVPSARGAHCATADDRGNVYVCDPDHGRLLTFADSFPSQAANASGRGSSR